MYGDTTVIARHADRLREQGTDLRALADRLVGQVDDLAWTGRAAEDLKARMRDRAAHLRSVAASHDDAADLLARHGVEVDHLKDAIAAAERRAAQLADDDHPTDAVTPPPGHKDWLTVPLPDHER